MFLEIFEKSDGGWSRNQNGGRGVQLVGLECLYVCVCVCD